MDIQQPTNSIMIEDGVIVASFDGDQTKETVHEIVSQAPEMIKKMRDEGSASLLLVMMAGHGEPDMGGRIETVKALNSLDYDKFAFCGHVHFSEHLAKFLLMAAGLGDKAQFFYSKEAAVRWLKGH